MIELSFSKLLLVAVIALIVLGPEKLPKAARMAGAMLRRARLGWESVRTEVEHELELEELRRAAKETRDGVTSVQKATTAAVASIDEAVKATVADVAADAPAASAPTAKEPEHGDA